MVNPNVCQSSIFLTAKGNTPAMISDSDEASDHSEVYMDVRKKNTLLWQVKAYK
jgi:hypothetical protein